MVTVRREVIVFSRRLVRGGIAVLLLLCLVSSFAWAGLWWYARRRHYTRLEVSAGRVLALVDAGEKGITLTLVGRVPTELAEVWPGGPEWRARSRANGAAWGEDLYFVPGRDYGTWRGLGVRGGQSHAQLALTPDGRPRRLTRQEGKRLLARYGTGLPDDTLRLSAPLPTCSVYEVPFSTPTFASLLPPVVWGGLRFRRFWVRRDRRRRGLCLACGYDLRASAGGRCSECGEVNAPPGPFDSSHGKPALA